MGSAIIEMRNFAGRLIKAEDVFKARDFIERFLRSRAKSRRIIAMKRHLKACRHRLPGHGYDLRVLLHGH
jgi:hypothetical protein